MFLALAIEHIPTCDDVPCQVFGYIFGVEFLFICVLENRFENVSITSPSPPIFSQYVHSFTELVEVKPHESGEKSILHGSLDSHEFLEVSSHHKFKFGLGCVGFD